MANTEKPKSSPSGKKRGRPRKIIPAPVEFEDVHDFWEAQAKTHGASDKATNPDQHYRKLEVEAILRVVGALKHDTILDVGCGNGFTTFKMAKKFPEAEITGVDFSESMIDEANKLVAPNTDFSVGNILSLSRGEGVRGRKYDVVLSTRVLINLANWEEQKVGILEMRKMLTPDGRLVLVENIKDGLDNLNSIRAGVGLPPISVRWHNKYIPQGELQKFFGEIKGHLLTQEYTENIGNFYYLASRVIYAKLCQDQGIEPDYNNPINKIASQLPTLGEFYACSPNFLIILKNEAGNGHARS
jgi:ubiquinone/menaquinone biosynthesis C-methylase UbiE